MELSALLEKVRNLSPLPPVVLKALRLIREDAPVSRLQNVISNDPSLTAKILRLANSAYYGLPRRVETLSEAIVVLGIDTLRNILLAAAAYYTMGKAAHGYMLKEGELWIHSVFTAYIADNLFLKLLKKRGKEIRSIRHIEGNISRLEEVVYLTALLHDIGKVALSDFIEDSLQKVKEELSSGENFLEVEKGIVGFSHPEAGAMVMEAWNFPEMYREVIGTHHNPSLLKDEALLIGSVVHAADMAAVEGGVGTGVDGMFYEWDYAALEAFRISSELIEESLFETMPFIEDLEEFVSLGL